MYTNDMHGFSIMAKPAGPLCNIDCSYCYYLEKTEMYPEVASLRMSRETLEVFTRKYIYEQPGKEVTFAWQGGEPTLMGLGFYRHALQLQQKYGSGKQISNSLQTNGILLNDEWCRFFKENNFLIGLSIDGPEELHDAYRKNRGGEGTFSKVIKGLELLRKHEVEFNTLTVVNNLNSRKPLEVYTFLKNIGSHYMQFIPVVERRASEAANAFHDLVPPEYEGSTSLTPWSVSALHFGNFLTEVFKEWIKKDVGTYFVQTFDAMLANELDLPPGICSFSERCGDALIMEHNGDLYSCDHYVYDKHKTGNIQDGLLKTAVLSAKQQQFGKNKHRDLPTSCRTCDVYRYCRGECPKNRFIHTAAGEPHLNYLCEGYQSFFRKVKPYVAYMANELRHRRPPSNVMSWARKNNTLS